MRAAWMLSILSLTSRFGSVVRLKVVIGKSSWLEEGGRNGIGKGGMYILKEGGTCYMGL